MFDKQATDEIVEKILKSAEFRESSRYQELLRYLVAANINKESVKEAAIAQDLFDKTDFDPHEDPTVRVYISNLRKKLKLYYLSEGKDDKIRIDIPKGHYDIQLVARESDFQVYKHLFFRLSIPVIIILIGVIIYLFIETPADNGADQNAYIDHPLWGDLLTVNESPTLVILGDYFFMFEHKPGLEEGYFVRDPWINSAEEFKQITKYDLQTAERFVPLNFTYLGPGTSESLAHLVPVLNCSKKKFYIKLASEFSLEELNRNNIIYIGPFKTLHEVKKLFSKLPVKFQLRPPELTIVNETDGNSEKFIATRNERTNYNKDFSVIIKYLSLDNHVILLFLGFDEIGVLEAVKNGINPDLKKQIEHQFEEKVRSGFPKLFTLVIATEGIDRTTVNSEIKLFNQIRLSE